MQHTIHVTDEDILQGKRYCYVNCPVARALNRATGQKWEVYRDRAFSSQPPKIVLLPNATVRRIADFDNGLGMEPFDFTIPITT